VPKAFDLHRKRVRHETLFGSVCFACLVAPLVAAASATPAEQYVTYLNAAGVAVAEPLRHAPPSAEQQARLFQQTQRWLAEHRWLRK
jgi:hypothetical protein